MSNVQKASENNVATLVTKYKKAFAEALPKQVDPDVFTRCALTALRKNPDLMKCEPMSYISALLTSAQLGLEPNTPTGLAYLIPYGNECTFQIGYQGLVELSYRTGKIKNIRAKTVYSNDFFEIEEGSSNKIVHKPFIGDGTESRGTVVGYYAIYETTDGSSNFEFMTKTEMVEYANKYSTAYRKSSKMSGWVTAFDSMAHKTVVKRVLKLAPKSVELKQALDVDNSFGRVRIDGDTIVQDGLNIIQPEDIPDDVEVQGDAENILTSLQKEDD